MKRVIGYSRWILMPREFRFGINVLIIALLIVVPNNAQAQAVQTQISATSGVGDLGTQITQQGNIYEIRDGTRPENGSNLFHSFHSFSIGGGDTAKFINNNNYSISNILSRVTGGNVSEIYGTIDTLDFPNANLFLFNPTGVLFGPGATLDIDGSFYVSTANYLKLGNLDANVRFYADPANQTASLTTADPSAFGFLAEQPASISIQEIDLTVPDGGTLAVIGGDLEITEGGRIIAAGGRIDVASVASPGEVVPVADTDNPDLMLNDFQRLGNIELSDRSAFLARGDGGGTVLIRGERLVLDNSLVSGSAFGPTESNQMVAQSGAGVDIKITDHILLDNFSAIESNVFFGVTAGSGGIRLAAEQIEINNGSQINSVVFGADIANGRAGGIGDGGDIDIEADSLLVQGNSIIRTNTGGTGDAGDIQLRVRQFKLLDNSFIGAFAFDGTGDAGDISIESELFISNGVGIFAQTQPQAEGNGGNINLVTDNLIMDGPVVQIATNTFGIGNGGNIYIRVNKSAVLSGSDSRPFFNNVSTATRGPGNAGNLSFFADSLELTNTASLETRSLGIGDSGNLLIEVNDLKLNDQATIFSGTNGPGQGGNIDIRVENRVLLTNNSLIETSSEGFASAGNAGYIHIAAGKVFESRDSTVTAQAEDADGGNIEIMAKDLVYLSNSEILTEVRGGAGNGGNITIDPTFVILENSEIIANAFEGAGGNIKIVADFFLASPDSIVQASSERGIDGTVEVDSPSTDVLSGVTDLPASLFAGTAVLTRPCAQRADTDAIRLVVRKYEIMPESPYALWDHLPDIAQAQDAGSESSNQPHQLYAGLFKQPVFCNGNE